MLLKRRGSGEREAQPALSPSRFSKKFLPPRETFSPGVCLILHEQGRLAAQRRRHAAETVVAGERDEVVASMSQTISEQQRKLQQQEHRLAQLLRQLYGPRRERFNPDQLTLFDAAELAALVQETAEAATAEEESISRQASQERARPTADPRAHSSRDDHLRAVGGRAALPGLRRGARRDRPRAERATRIHSAAVQGAGSRAGEVRLPEVSGARGAGRQAAAAGGKGSARAGPLGAHGAGEVRRPRAALSARRPVTRGTESSCVAARSAIGSPPRPIWSSRSIGGCASSCLQSRIIWTDDTTVKLLDALLGRARTARFWAYLGDRAAPVHGYDFTDSRARDGPQSFLRDSAVTCRPTPTAVTTGFMRAARSSKWPAGRMRVASGTRRGPAIRCVRIMRWRSCSGCEHVPIVVEKRRLLDTIILSRHTPSRQAASRPTPPRAVESVDILSHA